MTTTYTLAQLATELNAELRGEPDLIINGISTLQHAKTGQISFLNNPLYHKYLANTKASAVILSAKAAKDCCTNALVVNDPYLAFAKTAALFQELPKIKPGIHSTAILGKDCQIHSSASIGPYCVIGDDTVIEKNVVINANCSIGSDNYIGDNTYIWSNVTSYAAVKIGKNCIIHSGVVMGSDGFGFAQNKGSWVKVPQIGGVSIGNDVEIGANTTIDCGAITDTIIEDGVKLDNQIQIAHNVHVGAHTAIAGCTAIAGSTRIGKYCVIAGQVGIAGHLTIADKVIITAKAGVSSSISEPGIYSGFPAEANKNWRRNVVRIRQLDEIACKLNDLDKQIKNITNQNEE